MDKRRYHVAGRPRRNQKMQTATLHDREQCSIVPRPVSTREHISSAADSIVFSSILFRSSRSNPFLSSTRHPSSALPQRNERTHGPVPAPPPRSTRQRIHRSTFAGLTSSASLWLLIAVSRSAPPTAVLGCLCLEKVWMSDGANLLMRGIVRHHAGARG
jgi:hypothetical protein